jgi:hypothetical protein
MHLSYLWNGNGGKINRRRVKRDRSRKRIRNDEELRDEQNNNKEQRLDCNGCAKALRRGFVTGHECREKHSLIMETNASDDDDHNHLCKQKSAEFRRPQG